LAHPLGVTSSNSLAADDDVADGTGGDGVTKSQQQQQQQLLEAMDPLHPRSLPGGVRDAWASLCKSAQTLNVSGGEVDDDTYLMEGMTMAGAALSGREGEAPRITAAMIQAELTKAQSHNQEEYTLNRGQLGMACRNGALKVVLERECELEGLFEGKEGLSCLNVLEGGRREAIGRVASAVGVSSSGGEERDTSYYGRMGGDTDGGSSSGGMVLLNSFYARFNEVKAYHSQNGEGGGAPSSSNNNSMSHLTLQEQFGDFLSGQKRKHGHPLADGYDIASLIATETNAVRAGEVYTPEEMFGKYLDLVPLYEGEVRGMKHAFSASSSTSTGNADDSKDLAPSQIVSYLDFLTILSKGLATSIPEQSKLRDRRKYSRFLQELEKYLIGFSKRTSPFLDVNEDVVKKAVEAFETEWGEKGGVEGWECRAAEAGMVKQHQSSDAEKSESATVASEVGIDLSKYATSADLEKGVSGDELKSELARLGMKCGGTVLDRAARLFLTKDTPLDQLPAKVFAKKKVGAVKKTKVDSAADGDGATKSNEMDADPSVVGDALADRRVDIARLETIVSSLLDQLRPTLDGTRRRIERRTTQTENERDQEIDEEINGARVDAAAAQNKSNGDGDGSDDEDDEDTPIYNPKNVPLGWDGKPIPYWLFKLHGLNHFYPCEICGNESYRGRRNFEKHFTDSRHAYGMRCLGIPNTKHFHGVTKIEDAQELWGRLRKVLEGSQFDGDEEEEYEDSHGNVLNRAQFEDLARQGML
jgi:splicing factor 3A subunit 3